MARDPWQDPDAKAWVARTARDLTPKLRDSAIVMSLVPDGPPDVKFSVELGMAIMLDKPIMCVVKPGTHVPDHLVRVADMIVECDMEDDEDRLKLMQTIEDFIKKHPRD